MNNKLTFKQRKFVVEYLICWNASEAARRAGYRRQSNVVGSEMLRHPLIRAEIERKLNEFELSVDLSLVLLSRIARADMGDYITIKKRKPILDLQKAKDLGVLSLIRRVRVIKNDKENFSIELFDTLKALKIIAIIHGAGKGTWKSNLDEDNNPFDALLKLTE